MVRLKVKPLVQLVFKIAIISIPYGAIKRQQDLTKVVYSYEISIPYGAIKS